MDKDHGLVISCSREDLGLAGRDDSVTGDELCHDASSSLNTKGQGVNIHENDLRGTFVSREDTTLDSSAKGNSLIRVDTLGGLLAAKELLKECLDLRDTSGTTDENDIVNFGLLNLGVLEHLLDRAEGFLEQIHVQFLELGASQGLGEVLAVVEGLDLNTGGHLGREGTLGLLNLALQFTHGLEVLGDIDVVLLVVHLDEVVDDTLVEILTTQVSITGSGQDLEGAIINGQEGDIEGTSTEIVDDDLALIASLVQTVGDSCGGGFVDDTENIETGDSAGVLGGLSLVIVEVGGYSDDGVGDGLSKVVLGDLLHLAQDHGGHLLRSENLILAVNLNLNLGLAILVDNTEGEMLHVLLGVLVIEFPTDQTSLNREKERKKKRKKKLVQQN